VLHADAQSAAGVEIFTCGSCAWLVAGGVMEKSKAECADNCCNANIANCAESMHRCCNAPVLYFDDKGFSAIADGAISRLQLVTGITLQNTPLAELAPSAFAGNSGLQYIYLSGTALGCVPAGDIPDAVFQPPIPRCPAPCAPNTVYDASSAKCVACPDGLQPRAPGSVGGNGLGMCVPAGCRLAGGVR
jgi:hypothetical protein